MPSETTAPGEITPDYEQLLIEATNLFVALCTARSRMPEGSIQRRYTGRLANTIDWWCRFIEDSEETSGEIGQ